MNLYNLTNYRQLLLGITVLINGSISIDVFGKTINDNYKYDKKYDKYGIRIIKPKFFLKEGKIEFSATAKTLINETFLYTFGSGVTGTYFFSETIGLGLNGEFNLHMDKEEKRVLNDQHNLKTLAIRNNFNIKAQLEWDPYYGKWHFNDKNIVYFDTYFTLNAGVSGVSWQYKDFCQYNGISDGSLKSDQTISYPGYGVGIGQRYYLSKRSAAKWQMDVNQIRFDSSDASCFSSDSTDSSTETIDFVSLNFGYSYFLD